MAVCLRPSSLWLYLLRLYETTLAAPDVDNTLAAGGARARGDARGHVCDLVRLLRVHALPQLVRRGGGCLACRPRRPRFRRAARSADAEADRACARRRPAEPRLLLLRGCARQRERGGERDEAHERGGRARHGARHAR
eukprot:scaffold99796_cov70-Phaeocystis_antarctica.AAC.2